MVYGYRPDAGLALHGDQQDGRAHPGRAAGQVPAPGQHQAVPGYPGPDAGRLLRIAAQRHQPGAPRRSPRRWRWRTGSPAPGNFTYTLHGNLPQHGAALPDHRPARLLPAVRVRDGRAGPAARHPVPGRRRLHGRHPSGPRRLEGHRRPTRTPGRSCTSPPWAGLRFEPTPGGPAAQGTATRPNYPASVTGPIVPPGEHDRVAARDLQPRAANQGGVGNRLGPHVAGSRRRAARASTRAAGGCSRSAWSCGLVAAALLVAPGLTRVADPPAALADRERRRWAARTRPGGS